MENEDRNFSFIRDKYLLILVSFLALLSVVFLSSRFSFFSLSLAVLFAFFSFSYSSASFFSAWKDRQRGKSLLEKVFSSLPLLSGLIISSLFSIVLVARLLSFEAGGFISFFLLLPVSVIIRYAFAHLLPFSGIGSDEMRMRKIGGILTLFLSALLYPFFFLMLRDVEISLFPLGYSGKEGLFSSLVSLNMNFDESVDAIFLLSGRGEIPFSFVVLSFFLLFLEGGILFFVTTWTYEFLSYLSEREVKHDARGILKGILFSSFNLVSVIVLTFFLFSLGNSERVNGFLASSGLLVRENIDGVVVRAGTLDLLQAEKVRIEGETEEELVALVGKYFDDLEKDVDEYLDWYYSIPSQYEQIASMIAGAVRGDVEKSVETLMRGKMEEYISPDVDLLEESGRIIAEKEEELQNSYEKIISERSVEGSSGGLSIEFDYDLKDRALALAPDPVLSLPLTLSASAAGGIATGVVVSSIVEKAFSTAISRNAVQVVSKSIGSKAISSGVSAGLTLVNPVIGVLAGIGSALVIDGIITNIDEALNREEYKKAIMSSINDERANLLNKIKESFEGIT